MFKTNFNMFTNFKSNNSNPINDKHIRYEKVNYLDNGANYTTNLQELDEDIFIPSQKDETVELFDNLDKFFRIEECEQETTSAEHDYFEHLQYGLDEVPLAENLRPINRVQRIQPYSNNTEMNTDLSMEDKITLNRIHYNEKIIQSLWGKDINFDDGIADAAAFASLSMSERNVDELINKSIIQRNRRGEPKKQASLELFNFLIKHPGFRNHVVEVDATGTESFSKQKAYHYNRMLNVTRNIQDIKKSQRDVRKLTDDNLHESMFLSDFAVDIMKQSKKWGEDESKLLQTGVKFTTTKSGETIKEINRENVDFAKSLLKNNASTKETLDALNKVIFVQNVVDVLNQVTKKSE